MKYFYKQAINLDYYDSCSAFNNYSNLFENWIIQYLMYVLHSLKVGDLLIRGGKIKDAEDTCNVDILIIGGKIK